jgi:uncharacterized membrane protein YgdD (TMEM256/DUF423 family)
MRKTWLVVAGVSGFLSVAAGAFGAHALRKSLPADLMEIFETAVRYQMYHVPALLAVGVIASRSPSRAADVAGWAFTMGTVLFSGSLYAMALTGQKWLGAVTPFGGLSLLVGWVALIYLAARRGS